MSSEEMSLSVNGQSQVPPGFRFHPTEEELLHYYLRKKVAYEKIDLDVIRDVDLNKLEPWDIQEKCKIGSGPQNDWYFFSHKDKKYPTGTRTNRATAAGFWKATGRDKVIYSSLRRIGMRKTLVFYKGRAPHGQKSDWIMHEYRLDDNNNSQQSTTRANNNSVGDSISEDGWVVCRVFRKKNYQKTTVECPSSNKGSMDIIRASLLQQQMPTFSPGDDDTSAGHGVLDQILMYMGRSCKEEDEPTITNHINTMMDPPPPPHLHQQQNHQQQHHQHHHQGSSLIQLDRFVHLPRLDSPSATCFDNSGGINTIEDMFAEDTDAGLSRSQQQCDWVALDRLVASQLNGHAVDDSAAHATMSFAPPPSSAATNNNHSNDDDNNNNGNDYCVRFSNNNNNDNSSVGRGGGGGGGGTTTNRDFGSSMIQGLAYSSSESDLWSFNRSSSSSSSDPLSHLSV